MGDMNEHDRTTLITLLFSVFATVTGVGIVTPLLPVYAHGLGANGIYVGLVFGAFALSRTLFLPIFGRLSDTRGRKGIIVAGLFAFTAISATYVYAVDVTTLIVVRMIHGVASAMLMPVLQAYVGDITPPGREGRLMGTYSMFLLVGFSVGPVLGGFVNDHFGIDAAFLCMTAMGLLGLFVCLRWLPPTSHERLVTNPKSPLPWKGLLLNRTVASLFCFRFAYVVCVGIIWAFVPLLATIKLFLSTGAVGTVITIGILTSGALNMPMGMLADRTSKNVMVVIGGVIIAYAMLSFAWAANFHDLIASAVFFGLGSGISMPALGALATVTGSRNDAMGSTMAIMTLAHSIGMFAGAILGGIMMDRYDLQLAFPAGAGVMTMGLLLFTIGVFVPKRLLDARRAMPVDSSS